MAFRRCELLPSVGVAGTIGVAGWVISSDSQGVSSINLTFENRFSLCNTLPRLDRLLDVPEAGTVSDVDAVEPLNLVKTDDSDMLLLRLSRSLERQLLNREGEPVMLPPPLEVTD